ncbi:MAG: NAD(P)-dependent dehydrogenase (short-subunit alcohol dehydrogenase family) [Reinekea sp.]
MDKEHEDYKMKILVVGATGTIGKAVAERLAQSHDVIRVGYRNGEHKVDLGSKPSIQALFETVGPVDAVVSTAGVAGFAPFDTLNDAAFDLALSNKLMGQISLVWVGRNHITDGGSITLTAGILSHHPMPGTVAISMANGALESFSRAVALEIGRGLRVNTVSPAFVKETMELMGMDPTPGVSAVDTANAYVAAVEGDMNGQTLNVTEFL